VNGIVLDVGSGITRNLYLKGSFTVKIVEGRSDIECPVIAHKWPLVRFYIYPCRVV